MDTNSKITFWMTYIITTISMFAIIPALSWLLVLRYIKLDNYLTPLIIITIVIQIIILIIFITIYKKKRIKNDI